MARTDYERERQIYGNSHGVGRRERAEIRNSYPVGESSNWREDGAALLFAKYAKRFFAAAAQGQTDHAARRGIRAAVGILKRRGVSHSEVKTYAETLKIRAAEYANFARARKQNPATKFTQSQASNIPPGYKMVYGKLRRVKK